MTIDIDDDTSVAADDIVDATVATTEPVTLPPRRDRKNDPAARTVELDAKVLRKLVVSTVLDLGDESGSVPVRVVPPPDDNDPHKL